MSVPLVIFSILLYFFFYKSTKQILYSRVFYCRSFSYQKSYKLVNVYSAAKIVLIAKQVIGGKDIKDTWVK